MENGNKTESTKPEEAIPKRSEAMAWAVIIALGLIIGLAVSVLVGILAVGLVVLVTVVLGASLPAFLLTLALGKRGTIAVFVLTIVAVAIQPLWPVILEAMP